MNIVPLENAEESGSLALPQLTPHSFDSLPDAFRAALKAVSTLTEAVEELYALCEHQQRMLELNNHALTAISARMHTSQSEENRQEPQEQCHQSECAVPRDSHQKAVPGHEHHYFPHDYRKMLRRLEAVLLAGRSLNCNAEQYSHLLHTGQAAPQSVPSPVRTTILTPSGDNSQDKSSKATGEKKKGSFCTNSDEQLHSLPPTQSGQRFHEQPTISNGKTDLDDRIAHAKKAGKPHDAATADAWKASEVGKGSRRKCGSIVENDYELSVCKALLMLQHFDLHEENLRCSEEEILFSLGDSEALLQAMRCESSYAHPSVQRKVLYDILQKKVEERQTLRFRREPRYHEGDSHWQQQSQRRWVSLIPPSVLAGERFIQLAKSVVLEILLRIKVLQEAQRTLRADIILLRHQYHLDGQNLRLTLQKTVTTYGLEQKALSSRLQKLAALLQNV